MNDRNHTVDNLDFQLLRRYIDGGTSPEEDRAILEWLESSEDNPRFLSELLANISIHDTLTDITMDERCERMVSRINARIDADEPHRNFTRFIPRMMIGFAACAAAVVCMVLYRNADSVRDPESRPDTVYRYRCANTTASTRTLILGDNTKVYLRPGSELRYDVTERSDCRVASIVGEAYFDIARDTLRPFVVKTRNIGIKVLGTAFNVKSSSDCPDTEVLLERGAVCVLSPDDRPLLNMKPDQKIVYDEVEGVLSMEEMKVTPYIAETYKLITLENATIGDIISALNKNYGVSIECKGKPGNERFYFSYMSTDKVEDVLTVLEFISGKTYYINY